MIDHIDNMLRHLFLSRIGQLTDEAQIRFQPPDDAWRTYVSSNLPPGSNALNIYLADLRENRKLRSNERVRSVSNGNVFETPAPRRLDCHYLISAWSLAVTTPPIEPTADEHALLYQVIQVLMEQDTLVPREIYGSDPLPAGFPPEIADAELPASILPVEGFVKLSEFWTTMGNNHRWKPAIYLVVTLPVILGAQFAGPMVTTRITEFRRSAELVTAELWIQIGGQVRTAGGAAIPGAVVDIVEAGLRTGTDSQGHYTFPRVPTGTHNLRVVAVGYQPAIQPLVVPDRPENYDIVLTSL